MGLGVGLGIFRRRKGGVTFDPSSLNLDLDLRTPQYALNASTRASNGLITFNDPPTVSDPDITAYIDQSGNGYNFTQGLVSRMSHWNNTNFTGDHDGTDDRTTSSSFASAIDSDTQGVACITAVDNEGAGAAHYYWSYSNSFSVKYFLFGFNTSDEFTLLMYDSGNINVITSSETYTGIRGSKLTIFVQSNGSAYTAYIYDGSTIYTPTLVASTGANNGKWANEVVGDVVEIGSETQLGVFQATGFVDMKYRRTAFTLPTDWDNLRTWLTETYYS